MKNHIPIILFLVTLMVACEENQTEHSKRLTPFPYAKIDIAPTQFSINNSRDTLLFGKEGIILYIPAGSFNLKSKGLPVDIFLKEYIKPADALTQDISNASKNNQLLTSCQVIHLSAKQGNNELFLSQNHDIRVHFKRKPTIPNISLWKGEPKAWVAMDFDKPRLFNHVLRMCKYKDLAFADGSDPETWEKEHLALNPKEEELFWKTQASPHLNFTINDLGKIENIRFEEKVDPKFEAKILKALANYPVCVPYQQNGKPSPVQCQYVFHVHQAEPKYKKDVAYIGILDDPYPQLKIQKIDHIEKLETAYHIFNIHQLGWIAAAKALEEPASVDLFVEVETSFLAEVKIMLNNSKIVLSGIRKGNKVEFLGIPKNEPLQLIAFGEKEKHPILASMQANSSDGLINKLDFKQSSYASIKRALSEIN